VGLGAALLTLGLWLVALPLGSVIAAGTALVSACLLAAALWRWAPLIELRPAALQIGTHVVPTTTVTQITPLDDAAMRRQRGPALDARTRAVLRPGPRGGVLVATTTTPVLASVRRPEALARALSDLRAGLPPV
jgi:hypothetical protein